ncbi:MAG: hypothetical protein CM1200mP25_0240 [Acidobacteriota bacterium]|nr:MAG: hypothetical protein CM1200mP25_0240 [Acidobacteriota bacterium]
MRKRAIDIVISMIGLFGLAPMFVIVAVMIKFDSGGPKFFFPAGAYGPWT